MTIEEIKELLELFHASGVGEMEVQRGENRLRLTKAAPSPAVFHGAAPASETSLGSSPAPQPSRPEPTAESSLETIVSPIVGTFYEKPGPGESPFVKPGDHIDAGQVVCIIESMKLMNKVESEVAGTVLARLVEDASPVEYGQPLYSIRPD
jgi:acetyl-CoA carboxylase biotin carboxyl carrier protein